MTTADRATRTHDPSSDPAHRPLVVHRSPAAPRSAVLFLHGGQADGTRPPPLLNLPALRMRPFRRAVARADGRAAGVDEREDHRPPVVELTGQRDGPTV
ncbi:hypothetical protein ACWEQ8_09210, partial [Streptomyces noursei]